MPFDAIPTIPAAVLIERLQALVACTLGFFPPKGMVKNPGVFQMGGFHQPGYPQPGWFVSWNIPLTVDDLGVPLFQEFPTYVFAESLEVRMTLHGATGMGSMGLSSP